MEQLHQWVTTVDHKRLGLLYIFYALVFLVIGGVEATIMRIQLIRPLNDFRLPSGVQPDVHHAWNDHDFLRGHAAGIWICELPDSPDDWRARYGVSAPERLQLLDDGFRRAPPLFQFCRRRRTLWRRQRSGRWVVCLRSPDLADIFAEDTAPTSGHCRCWFPASGASEPRPTSSPLLSACGARE